MNDYCVYITFYKGNKLPPFYIGSTSVEKINNDYNGSVGSQKYIQMYGKKHSEETKEKMRQAALKRKLE
jgi:hypothetical protein